MNRLRKTITVLVAAAGLMAAGVATAGPLENLERERAILIQTYLSPEVGGDERVSKSDISVRCLVDLERMVFRDQKTLETSTPSVQNAFENYELTFLVHASVEKDRAILDHWLEQMGVSTSSIMNARTGRR